MQRVLVAAAIAAAIAAAMSGCADPTGVSWGEPTLQGTVAATGRSGTTRSVLVASLEMPASGYGEGIELFVRWPGRTALVYVRSPDGTLRPGSLADITVGTQVVAWNTGVERRSLPPQWDAARVVVLQASP